MQLTVKEIPSSSLLVTPSDVEKGIEHLRSLFPKKKREVTLVLDEDEAIKLKAVLGAIGGNGSNPIRRVTSGIYWELEKHNFDCERLVDNISQDMMLA